MHSLHTSNAAHAASLSVVEKTDDLISALKLVRSTFAAGNVAANAPAASDREPTTDELAAPGLLSNINAYYEGRKAFNQGTEDQQETDAFVASTYGDAFRLLKVWDRPAVTRSEAMAALHLADEELQNGGDGELATVLVRAALHFFEIEQSPAKSLSATPNRSAANRHCSEKIIGRYERLMLRTELDSALSLLDMSLHALRCEHEYQQHQVRPTGLPPINALIKTLQVCAWKLEECWSELKLDGDDDFDHKLWRPAGRAESDGARNGL